MSELLLNNNVININDMIGKAVIEIISNKDTSGTIKKYIEAGKEQLVAESKNSVKEKINDTFSQAKLSGIQELAKTDYADKLIASGVGIAAVVRQFANKEIDSGKLITELKNTGIIDVGTDFVKAAGLDVQEITTQYSEILKLSGYTVAYAAFSEAYEVLMEALEDAEIAYQNRIAIEERCSESIAFIKEYRLKAENIISDYFSEHYEVINSGFGKMDEAIITNDSNKYIRGNVELQTLLGREAQFSSQEEFDDLMDSDLDFRL